MRAPEVDYDRIAESYDQRYTEHDYGDIEATLREFVCVGCRVLEVGGLDPSRGTDEWYVYEYFNGTRELDDQRYPSSDMISSWFREGGFDEVSTTLVQRIRRSAEARSHLERGAAAKHVTSQLALLSDEEYEAGIERIWDDIRHAEARGATHQLRSDLRIYATSGQAPG